MKDCEGRQWRRLGWWGPVAGGGAQVHITQPAGGALPSSACDSCACHLMACVQVHPTHLQLTNIETALRLIGAFTAAPACWYHPDGACPCQQGGWLLYSSARSSAARQSGSTWPACGGQRASVTVASRLDTGEVGNELGDQVKQEQGCRERMY